MTDVFEEDKSLCGFLTSEDLREFEKLGVPELEVKLAEKLQLTNYVTSLESGIVLDYYVSGFWDGFSINKNSDALKSQLKNLGTVPDSDNSPHLQTKDALLIADYLVESLFQHYKLYQVLFSSQQDVTELHQKLTIESLPPASLPFPGPLEEGMPKDLYERFIAPPPEILPLDEAAQQGLDEEDPGEIESQGKTLEGQNEEASDNLLEALPPEVIHDLVAKITAQKLEELKAEYRKKLKDKESAILNKLNRLTVK